jgi:hypothetical protein
MNHIRDIIHRLQQGESERQISRDTRLSRPTVHKYKVWAQEQGYLSPGSPLPELTTLAEARGAPPSLPRPLSSLEAYREKIAAWQKEGVEMMAMWHRLREDYGYSGSYSSIRRFCKHLRPPVPEAVVRVHRVPGEELQVDPSALLRTSFGSVGKLYGNPKKIMIPKVKWEGGE